MMLRELAETARAQHGPVRCLPYHVRWLFSSLVLVAIMFHFSGDEMRRRSCS